MSDAVPFTGERFLPGVPGEIAYEHVHRYAFARRFARGRRVLDAACGEGYGAAILASMAASVLGIDIDAATIARSRERYAAYANLRFDEASVTTLPCADASVDVVVSFETIEHIGADDQRRMLAEFRRVLTPNGLLVLSSPNRVEYSERSGYRNPFHVHELDRDELAALLEKDFSVLHWYRQRRYLGSSLWAEAPRGIHETLTGSAAWIVDATPPEAMYFVVVATVNAAASAMANAAPDATATPSANANEIAAVGDLPRNAPAVSLFTDDRDSEWARIDHEAREVLRLDSTLIVRERELADAHRRFDEVSASLAQHDQRIAALTAEHERRVAELMTERERQQHALAAQEHIIDYRQSVRWWLTLPWLRVRRAWDRIRSA